MESASSTLGFALSQQKAMVSGWIGDSLQQEPVVHTNMNIICQATPFTVPLLCDGAAAAVQIFPIGSYTQVCGLDYLRWTHLSV